MRKNACDKVFCVHHSYPFCGDWPFYHPSFFLVPEISAPDTTTFFCGPHFRPIFLLPRFLTGPPALAVLAAGPAPWSFCLLHSLQPVFSSRPTGCSSCNLPGYEAVCTSSPASSVITRSRSRYGAVAVCRRAQTLS